MDMRAISWSKAGEKNNRIGTILMTKGLVTLFGGSGFIGRYAARQLVKAGWQVRVACRRPGAAGDVRLAGAPGWVDIVQANVRNRASIARALEGADAVVNLCLLYTSPSPRDKRQSRMPSSA